MERARMNTLSGWLTVLPISQNHYDLTAQEFRDALALRYRKPFKMSLPVVMVVVLLSPLIMLLFVGRVA